MAPRDRTPKNRDLEKIPNLYRKRDKRTNRDNFQYKDPRDGRFRGLGADEEVAKKRAKQLNAAIYAQLAQLQQDSILTGEPVIKISGIKFELWIAEYLKIQDERLKIGEIKQTTHRFRCYAAKQWAISFAGFGIRNISVKDISTRLNAMRDQDKNRMAQAMRSILIDIFSEAIQAGEVDANPVTLTKNKTVQIKRARLTFEVWQEIFQAADVLQPFVQHGMLLALVSAQRLEDISLAQFKKGSDWDAAYSAYKLNNNKHPIKPYPYVDGDFFHVLQQKTGALLRIPLALKLDILNMSLGDVIANCRKSGVLSKRLIHHDKNNFKHSPGDPVHQNTISRGFQRARELTTLTWEGKNPPTFHEQRSLSERLYADQGGINTTILLGHKSAKMTAVYHDVRNADWLEIALK
ncbi:MAG: phage integrase Arm DNA-binding domain-containing protein [Methylobacter sp.]|jgi:integrase